MEYSDTIKKILEKVKAENAENYDEIISLLDSVSVVQKHNRTMLHIGLVINLVLSFFLIANPLLVIGLMFLHALVFAVTMNMNFKEIGRSYKRLEEIGFPFEELKAARSDGGER